MKRIAIVIFVAAALALLIYVFYPAADQDAAVLRLYAGAGLRPAVEKLVAAFRAETGIVVEPDYGGSGLILSRAKEDEKADLFLPGDEWYVNRLQEFTGRVAKRAAIAYFVPTLMVARGNPKNVKGLKDLAREDLRVGLGKAKACQIGRVSAKLLEKAGVNTAGLSPQESLTVNELGVWVKMDAVDAAIVWDAIAANMSNTVETVSIPPEQNIISRVVLARLSGSSEPDAADRFLAFVHGPEGQRILAEAGYRVTAPARP